MIRRGAALACLLLAVFAVACGSPEEKLQRHLDAASRYAEQNKLPEAVIELRNALKLDPKRGSTNARLGFALQAAGEYNEALFYFEQAYRLDPKLTLAGIQIARLLQEANPQRAQAQLELLLQRDPGHPNVQLLRSDFALAKGDLDEGLAAAMTALELAPKSVRAANQVGMAHRVAIRKMLLAGETVPEERYRAAIDAFDHAAAVAGEGDENWKGRQTALLEKATVYSTWAGHRSQVLDALAEALATANGNLERARPVLALANEIAIAGRDPEFAHWAATRRLDLEPKNPDAWVALARAEDGLRRDGGAVMKRMLGELPDDATAHVRYAEYLRSQQRDREALEHLEQVVTTAVPADVVQMALVALLTEAGQVERADAIAREMQKTAPESANTFIANAHVAIAQRHWDAAAEWLRRAAGAQSTVQVQTMLAEIELQRGRPADALRAIDEAIALRGTIDGSAVPQLVRRGRILEAMGDHAGAVQAFAQAFSLGPLPPMFVPDAAAALYATGEREKARRFLDEVLGKQFVAPRAALVFAKYERQTEPARARELLQRALQVQPRSAPLLRALLALEVETGHPEAALALVRTAAEANPDDPNIQILLVESLGSAGRLEEATAGAKDVFERFPEHPGIPSLYARLLTASGRVDEAIASLEAAQKQRPTQGGRVLLASLAASRGDDERAIELLQGVHDEAPQLTHVKNDLAFLLAKNGRDLERAAELAKQARSEAPESAEIADTLGFVFFKQSLHEPALLQFQAALDLADPKSASWAGAQYHRALALEALARREEALSALDAALASGTEFAEAKQAHELRDKLAASAAGMNGKS